MVDFKPLDFAGFVDNFHYYSHVFVASARSIVFEASDFVSALSWRSIVFEALDFVSALSWTWKLISLVIVIFVGFPIINSILKFLLFLLFLPFKIILKIIKGVGIGIIKVTSKILDWTIWPIQIPVKLAGYISQYTNIILGYIIRYVTFSTTVGDNPNIQEMKRFKDLYDRLKIICDLCVGFVIGFSTPGVYASAVIYIESVVIYIENVENQAIAIAMKYSALFVGWLYHHVCAHWIPFTVLAVFYALLQFIKKKVLQFIKNKGLEIMRNLSLLIGFLVTYEKLIPHFFEVWLKLSLFMGFLKILRSISHSFGMVTFIIVAVAAYYLFGFPSLKFE